MNRNFIFLLLPQMMIIFFINAQTPIIRKPTEVVRRDTQSTPPSIDFSSIGNAGISCNGSDLGPWTLCRKLMKDHSDYEQRIFTPRSFKLINTGGNKTLPQSGGIISREYEFLYVENARSEIALLLWDLPEKDNDKKGHMLHLTFLPRLVTPSVEISAMDPQLLLVTLPTQEEVYFRQNTLEVASGVFLESPVQTDQNKTALKPKVEYIGHGLVLAQSRVAEYPINLKAKNNIDVIYRSKVMCQLSSSELWHLNKNPSKKNYLELRPEFATDDAIINYINKTCSTRFNLKEITKNIELSTMKMENEN